MKAGTAVQLNALATASKQPSRDARLIRFLIGTPPVSYNVAHSRRESTFAVDKGPGADVTVSGLDISPTPSRSQQAKERRAPGFSHIEPDEHWLRRQLDAELFAHTRLNQFLQLNNLGASAAATIDDCKRVLC